MRERHRPVSGQHAHHRALGVLFLFVVYQLYRYSYTHSLGLVLLSAFDLVVIALVWHEWRSMQAAEPAR